MNPVIKETKTGNEQAASDAVDSAKKLEQEVKETNPTEEVKSPEPSTPALVGKDEVELKKEQE